MRPALLTALAASALAAAGAMAPGAAEQAPQPRAYQPVPVALPQPVQDDSFHAFRKLLVDIAGRKDRVALAKLIARDFFWIADGKDIAVRSRPGIDTLSRAIDLRSPDGEGWDMLAAFASDPTADPDPRRKGVICAPGDPKYDAAAADAIGKLTGTPPSAWYFPLKDGIDVRSGMTGDSPVIGTLGMHLVWVHPDDSPLAAVRTEVVRIVMPSGKLGFVSTESLAALPADLLCYVKAGNAWSIAGVVGGDAPGK